VCLWAVALETWKDLSFGCAWWSSMRGGGSGPVHGQAGLAQPCERASTMRLREGVGFRGRLGLRCFLDTIRGAYSRRRG
jgi:hypothetical protein